jgi:alpha-glucosidase
MTDKPEKHPVDKKPEDWWKNSVFYQIYPRSFALLDPEKRQQRIKNRPVTRLNPLDENAEFGDLNGIASKLDYLNWLGIDAIWLSPIFESPMADAGYDVSDYCEVDPIFGEISDLKHLLSTCRKNNLSLILDWVPNHTSILHPWFKESRATLDNPKRNWYWWRNAKDGGPPNNWKAAFKNLDAWSFDEKTKQYYLHLFLPEQPDLNWHNEEVKTAMNSAMESWYQFGIDGFRIDAIHCISKNNELLDSPENFAWAPRSAYNDGPEVHPIINKWRKIAKSYEHKPVLIGEVFLFSIEAISKYYGNHDELDMAFMFPMVFNPFKKSAWEKTIKEVYDFIICKGHWPAWTLSNHDLPRYRSRVSGSEKIARAAGLCLLFLPGCFFIYQGEELGLSDAIITQDQKIDPGNRDGSRAPFPWDPTPNHGWAFSKKSFLPFAPEADTNNVETSMNNPKSTLNFYKSAIEIKKLYPEVFTGGFELIDLDSEDMICYVRYSNSKKIYALINFSKSNAKIPEFLKDYRVILCSSPDETEKNFIGGHTGLILIRD